MKKKRVLYVSQEINPYTGETTMGGVANLLPQKTQEKKKDIRIFLPRFGTISERRHQLHEVIRLSGMNLIIDDFDHQLIIKVASIQKLRLQVYFIDNEEYFPSKQMFHDLEGNFMSNNDERMIFYCKGVIETVRKLGWAPDIIHCQGWFTSLVPMYIKKLYAQEPLFDNVKVIYSVFDTPFDGALSSNLSDKLLFEKLEKSDVSMVEESTISNLHKFAVDYADAVVQASDTIDKDVLSHIKSSGKPFMEYPGAENYIDAYQDFYEQFIEQDEECEESEELEEEVALIEN
ncbi:MAG: glycogen synthase [Cryomorphaceae bacterium BACL11 MAG-121128-bin16]|jgi:starch synthase|nr:MAG: glycogen synthase [Cryomorphaceae bacterium BACL11 MAG-121015-bin20]KRO70689.1 MAG: glycogen synthase [Cryomorphaceae bacterium BACL11 MAG-121128-bin16]